MKIGSVGGMRFVKKISDRGTLTIPSDVREALDLKDGDLVDVHIVGVVARRAASSPPAPSGAVAPLPSPSSPTSLEHA
jgi:AbrB family looped-hinge helix DNA binding protein